MMSLREADSDTPNLFISALWLLLHTIVTWVEYLSRLVRRCRKTLSRTGPIGVMECSRFRQSQQFIRTRLKRVAKVPRHLVVLLGPEQPDYQRLAQFIFWSYAAGIEYVSLYDHNGTIKRNHEQIRRYVLEAPLDEKDAIVWWNGPKPDPADRCRKRTVVTCLAPEDGKQGLVNLSRSIGESVRRRDLTASEVDVDFLDSRLQAARNYVPDPDLAVYFGDICSTYGLLPWQIRLTEFLQLGWQLRDSNELHFVNVLLRFAKCEQRLGT